MAQEAGPQPLEGSTRVLASLAVALATFMNVLDTSIANVSIPAIAGDLGVSPNQGTWTITSFAVANAISVPLTGWLTQRYGQVRLFLATTALFVVASLLCGLAVSMPMLVFFRVVQGAVAGPMIPLSQTLLLSTYPREKAGMALAMFSLTILVAPVVGPVLGGWITDNFSWPWIFFINIPVGLISLAMTWTLYRDRETPRVKTPIDTAGLVLLVIWVGALQLVLDKGKDLDWFESPEIIALAIAAALAFCLFLVWELTDKHPVVDLSLGGLRQDQIAAASGLNNFLRISAGGFAASIATTLWEGRAALHHARMVERMSASDPATSATLQSLSALGMAPEQQYAFLNQMVNRQAFTLSALDLFYGSALLLVALIPLLWIARPPRRDAGASATGAH